MAATLSNPIAPEGPLTILIDNDCPLCKREGQFLAWLDQRKGGGRLRLIDITSPDFRAEDYGTTFDAVMGTIHAVSARGAMLTGMEVFRQAYAAVGMPWLLGWTRWPIARPISDWGYRLFAKYRLRMPGRTRVCEDGRCRVPGAG